MVFMLFVLYPQKVEAVNGSTYKYRIVANLGFNKWQSIKHSTLSRRLNYYGYYYQNEYNMYKLVVPSNGYIKVQNKGAGDVEIYNSLPKTDMPLGVKSGYIYGSDSEYVAVTKGTYYFCSNTENAKIKITFTKINNSKNYCSALSKNLGSSKSETIVFNPGYEYARWYKIKLNKQKSITIKYQMLDGGNSRNSTVGFQLFKSNMNEIYCSNISGKDIIRTSILDKGVYYIKVSPCGESYYSGNHGGRIRVLSWQ